MELTTIDAHVAEHITWVAPQVHWEDSCSGFQYETLGEALDAMRDPVIRSFVSREPPESAVVEEIRTFPAYSTRITVAFQVVEALGHLRFNLQSSGGVWSASFADNPAVTANSAPLAICLAGLAEKGFDSISDDSSRTRVYSSV